MQFLIFWLLAAVAVASALLVVILRRAVYGALALIVCFGAMAGLFFQLGAQFIAAIQVIVYAGAIMVLFLFVIMLLDPETEAFAPGRLKRLSLFAVPLGLLLAALLLQSVRIWQEAQRDATVAPGGDIASIGRSLFRDYLLPFEVTSILILAAIVGAVVLTKRPNA